MSWRVYAACLDSDPELFFPNGSDGPGSDHQIREAKRVCAGCAVQSVCLEWAILARIPYGIWGGTDENERRQSRGRTSLAVPQLPAASG